MKSKRLVFLLFILLLLNSIKAQTGSPDSLFNKFDRGFSHGNGPNHIIYKTITQPDGKVLVAGNFTKWNEENVKLICRLDNGFLDTSFKVASDFVGTVYDMALQADGKIVVVGNFDYYQGVLRRRILRLHPNGLLDLTFNPGDGFNDVVRCVFINDAGKIYCGGAFTQYSGTFKNRFLRLHSNGNLDTTFVTSNIHNGSVNNMFFDTDGSMFLGGSFTIVGGVSSVYFVCLYPNGLRNPWWYANFGHYVNVIRKTADGKYLVGGQFDQMNGFPVKGLALFDSSGFMLRTFNPGVGFNQAVNDIQIRPNGNIIVGGAFTKFNDDTVGNLVELLPNGQLNTTFPFGKSIRDSGSSVNTIQLYNNGDIIVSGKFKSYNGYDRNSLVRIKENGAIDLSLNVFSGFNGKVRTIAHYPDGRLLVGGSFTCYNGYYGKGLVRLFANGSVDSSFHIGMGIGANPFYSSIYQVAIQPDNKIIVAGSFFKFNNKPVGNLIRLLPNGVLDSTFYSGVAGLNGTINCLKLLKDGKMYVAGEFDTYDNSFSQKIARILPNGKRDTTFRCSDGALSGFAANVYALEVQNDGKILVGGFLSKYKNTNINNRIVRLWPNGDLDESFDAQQMCDGGIYSISIQENGKIVIGGNFQNYDSRVNRRIARLLSNGILDSTFYPGSIGFDARVNKVLVQPDGKILVGGLFQNLNGVPQKRIIRLNPNGSVDGSISFSNGFTDSVEVISLQPDGKILVGGSFTSYNGIGKNRLVRINNPCIPNYLIRSIVACNSYLFNGNVLTQSGYYNASFTSVFGCDSIVELNLTILPKSLNELQLHACDSFVWNGLVYKNSGPVQQVFLAQNGCDSVVMVQLKVSNSFHFYDTVQTCDSFIWHGATYNQSGVYQKDYSSHASCDSIFTLHLTLTKIDTSLSKVGRFGLMANMPNAQYQWLSCVGGGFQEISGATNAVFVATNNGSYAVKIVKNNCIDTSVCYTISSVGLNPTQVAPEITIAPNPSSINPTLFISNANGMFAIKIINYLGEELFADQINAKQLIEIPTEKLAVGIYLLLLEQNGIIFSTKIVKQ